MGRKPSRWTNLPTGMRARERGKKVHYYLDIGGRPRKEIPLGSDYVVAVQEWSRLTEEKRSGGSEYTFVDLKRDYWLRVIPTKAPRTQQDNEKEAEWLLKFFGNPPAPLDKIEPVHINQYMAWRIDETRRLAFELNNARAITGKSVEEVPENMGHVRANREKALFSHMWNYARKIGKTKLANPCSGVGGHRETGRDNVIDDEAYSRVLAHSANTLKFALRLASLVGQRPADVLKMSESDILGGYLHVKQGKTRAKLRIEIAGELAALLDEIRDYKAQFKTYSMRLLVNESGQALTEYMFRTRFDAAREAAGVDKNGFQFRDFRPTAATQLDDAHGIKSAQALLGHTTEAMTSEYIRHKVGKKVKPAR